MFKNNFSYVSLPNKYNNFTYISKSIKKKNIVILYPFIIYIIYYCTMYNIEPCTMNNNINNIKINISIYIIHHDASFTKKKKIKYKI